MDLSWIPPGVSCYRCIRYVHWTETPGQTHEPLEKSYLTAGLGTSGEELESLARYTEVWKDLLSRKKKPVRNWNEKKKRECKKGNVFTMVPFKAKLLENEYIHGGW